MMMYFMFYKLYIFNRSRKKIKTNLIEPNKHKQNQIQSKTEHKQNQNNSGLLQLLFLYQKIKQIKLNLYYYLRSECAY